MVDSEARAQVRVKTLRDGRDFFAKKSRPSLKLLSHLKKQTQRKNVFFYIRYANLRLFPVFLLFGEGVLAGDSPFLPGKKRGLPRKVFICKSRVAVLVTVDDGEDRGDFAVG